MLPAGTLAALPESPRRPLAGFADEYLADGVPFGGRDAELDALDAWLADRRGRARWSCSASSATAWQPRVDRGCWAMRTCAPACGAA